MTVDGAVAATYRSDEFGISIATTGTSAQPLRFTGEPHDGGDSPTSGRGRVRRAPP